jgi:hypothetical protein
VHHTGVDRRLLRRGVSEHDLGIGTGFHRVRRDWFLVATLELARQRLTRLDGGMTVVNPSILGTTSFVPEA